jgi:adenosylhomocysteine nucleosidase
MRIKLFVALPSEFPKEKAPLGVDVIYTGVGKVNAAIKTTEILKDLSPSETIVINFGSAGSSDYKIGELIKCLQFQQLTFGNSDVCFTTDTFQSNTKRSICDMEAYSIAKVCKIYGFEFVSYKFISDNGDANDWKKNHNKGITKFLEKLKEDFKVS